MPDLCCSLGTSVSALPTSVATPSAATVPVTGQPWSGAEPTHSNRRRGGRVDTAASVKQRMALAKQAYDNAIHEAMADLQASGLKLSAAVLQEALGVSRATAYRYMQRLRRSAEAANA